jgi:hypothetical protein
MPFWYPFLSFCFCLDAFPFLRHSAFLFLHHVHSYSWVTMAFLSFGLGYPTQASRAGFSFSLTELDWNTWQIHTHFLEIALFGNTTAHCFPCSRVLHCSLTSTLSALIKAAYMHQLQSLPVQGGLGLAVLGSSVLLFLVCSPVKSSYAFRMALSGSCD